MNAQNYLLNILISIIITLAVVLIPYIAIRLITHRHIQEKTAKIITIIYSVISFFIFLIIGFLTESEAVLIFLVILWNTIGYFIIKPESKEPQEIPKSSPDKMRILDSSVTIDSSFDEHTDKRKKERSFKQKQKTNNKIVIALSVTTAVFGLATIGLTAGVIYQNNEIYTMNEELVSVSRENGNLKEELEWSENTADAYFSDRNELQAELYAYHKYAVCVNKNSTYYHKPNCEFLDKPNFNIYSAEEAKSRGYSECPYCF